MISMCSSVHRVEQSLVRPPLCLRVLRPEDEPEDQVLRVRSAAGLQEVLRQVPARIEEAPATNARVHAQEDTGLRSFFKKFLRDFSHGGNLSERRYRYTSRFYETKEEKKRNIGSTLPLCLFISNLRLSVLLCYVFISLGDVETVQYSCRADSTIFRPIL